MPAMMDIEIGVPVADAVADGEGPVQAGILPAGKYATLVYTGIANGYEANAALIAWGMNEGLKWDSYGDEKGEVFGARYESYLTDPAVEPDQTKWETEVAIRLAE
jgi:effector-binding domain-containing protein